MEQVKIEASRKIVEETRRLYGTVLSKPLDEKQLLRPSFKFIQDLVKSLMVETKLLRDVFNANHFASTADKRPEKRAKMEFVQKLIDFAANNRQPVASCLAAKVVAGLEPNKTNELLQSLARIAQQKLNEHDERRPRTFTKKIVVESVGSTSGGGSRRSSTVQQRVPSAGKTTPLVNAAAAAASIEPPKRKKVVPEIEHPQLEEQTKVNNPTIVVEKRSSIDQADVNRSIGDNRRSSGASTSNITTKSANLPPAAIISESDIVKGTQLLRVNLRALGETFTNIAKIEDSLRASLLVANKVENRH